MKYFLAPTRWRRSVHAVAVSSVLTWLGCNSVWDPWLQDRCAGGSSCALDLASSSTPDLAERIDMATIRPASFQATTSLNTGMGPIALAVGFFDSGTQADLIVVNSVSANVHVFLGVGNGMFNFVGGFLAGMQANAVAAGLFNNDGSQDLAVVNLGSANVSVLLNNSAGMFSGPTNVNPGAGVSPYAVAVADVNGNYGPPTADG